MNAIKIANYTKIKARELQKTLYLFAKENPKRKFHALYDKIYLKKVVDLTSGKLLKLAKRTEGRWKISVFYSTAGDICFRNFSTEFKKCIIDIETEKEERKS